jgi:hypothetical protein
MGAESRPWTASSLVAEAATAINGKRKAARGCAFVRLAAHLLRTPHQSSSPSRYGRLPVYASRGICPPPRRPSSGDARVCGSCARGALPRSQRGHGRGTRPPRAPASSMSLRLIYVLRSVGGTTGSAGPAPGRLVPRSPGRRSARHASHPAAPSFEIATFGLASGCMVIDSLCPEPRRAMISGSNFRPAWRVDPQWSRPNATVRSRACPFPNRAPVIARVVLPQALAGIKSVVTELA